MYPLSLAIGLLSMVINFCVIYIYRNHITSGLQVSVAIYTCLPIVGVIIQSYIYGLSIMLWTNSMALIIVFLIMIYSQTKMYYENEQKLTEMKMEVMISQIQPHFLYNSFAVIDQLMKKDPELARKALNSFSTYLRCNINSLKRIGLIDFSEEFKHIEAYLTLEKMRYGEFLNVVYDIQVDNFMLPPLSIQPLVENAVQHGLSDKEDGGTVTIKTRELEDRYLVIVSDDGLGFDNENNGNGNHIGIENIRSRLHSMCHGSLDITSNPGQGTVVTVNIFKGDKEL
jgi:two-component system LytT family sensor kinase